MFLYHQKTKHSYTSIRSNRNVFDWSSQPSTDKRVTSFKMKLENINPPSPRDEMIENAYTISNHVLKCKSNFRFEEFSFNKDMFEESLLIKDLKNLKIYLKLRLTFYK